MPESIPSSIERLTRQYVDGWRFSSSDEVLLFAMSLFAEFEQRYHNQMGRSLQEAFRSIDDHEGVVLNGVKEVEVFFADMMDTNRQKSRFPKDG